MTSAQVLRGWGWVFAALMAGMLLLPVFGCTPMLPDLSKAAGYSAPADFTKGVGEATFFPSSDGRTVYWEAPYYNNTEVMMFCSIEPTVHVKDNDGKIVWTGTDPKTWSVKPGQQGRIGGKIVIPESVVKPTLLRWERGAVPSVNYRGQAATK